MSESSGTTAHKVYNIAHWSDGYIGVNEQGQVLIRPDRGHSPARINLPDLTQSLLQSGIQLPVLIRFTDILHDRVNKLCGAFNKVAGDQSYQASTLRSIRSRSTNSAGWWKSFCRPNPPPARARSAWRLAASPS